MINKERIRKLKSPKSDDKGPVCYWMSRDQRAYDNWALLFAQEIALSQKKDLLVVFCLGSSFLGATIRQFSFMIEGLAEVKKDLGVKNIPFYVINGSPSYAIPQFVKDHDVSVIISDFDPLRIKKKWKKLVKDNLDIGFFEVDAHNIVPCWVASDKAEYGAYTIRPKIKKKLPVFLEDYHVLKKMPGSSIKQKKIDWEKLYKNLDVDRSIKPIDWVKPGSSSAFDTLEVFLEKGIYGYKDKSNDPTKDAQSGMSPFIHFGSISSQRIALEIERLDIGDDIKWSYLEQLIIRKELSDNHCNYMPGYDNASSFPGWSKKTLDMHIDDKRDHIYTVDEFEHAKTHDPLWNACQNEMVYLGKMHGYMRMYWAKKILEWSKDYNTALKTAIYLNDRYELDGRDPNGYTGIAWSIGGLHDRAWKEREIFGKVRYMSYNGARSKFDIDAYIKKYS